MARVRAPELAGRGGWLNTGGRALSLADLRGRIVLLDFWTFCCVNCLHVLDELRPLEERYADCLVVVGVHSPKFAHEADHDALAAAVARYEVRHPVLDDPELETWRQYAVRAWPTLAVIDPEGYVVAQYSGEGHDHALAVLVAELVAEHEAKGTLRRGDGPYVPPAPIPGDLAFPGKVTALPGGDLLVSDTGHHRLVVLGPDGATVRRRVGGGERGLVDGDAATARFAEPGGVALLPPDVASAVGYDAVVADTANHVLRGLRLADGAVTTVAGTGAPWRSGDPVAGAAGEVPLSSPWDVAWRASARTVAVAMAGTHQLWSFDPEARTVEVLAGTTNEGLVDGEPARAWFAQPSGLAAVDDLQGETLWLVDAETSALRRLRNGVIHTEVGRGLFDFGHVDGPAGDALLQHPLGLTVLPDGSVAVCDTYNGAVRRFDPATGEVTTLAMDLAEPADAVVVPDEERGDVLLVVESAAHRLVRVPLPDDALRHDGGAMRTQRPAASVRPGDVALTVTFRPPTGQHLDERYGPATYLVVSSSPPELLESGGGGGTGLTRALRLSGEVASGVLHVSARAASCDADEGVEHPACHVHQQDWGVPVTLAADGAARVDLVLAG